MKFDFKIIAKNYLRFVIKEIILARFANKNRCEWRKICHSMLNFRVLLLKVRNKMFRDFLASLFFYV